MLPITRATINNFCRACLQNLDKSKNTTVIKYDLKDEPQHLRILESMAERIQPKRTPTNLAMPTRLCHSCYTKVSIFCKFAETSICTGVAMNELVAEQQELTGDAKFQKICATCFALKFDYNATLIKITPEIQNLLRIIFLGIGNKAEHQNNNGVCKHCFQKCTTFLEFQKTLQESQKYLESTILSNTDVEKDYNLDIKTEIQENVNAKEETSSFDIVTTFNPTKSSPDNDDTNGSKGVIADSENISKPSIQVYCLTCHKEYKTQSQLKVHIKRVHCKAENMCPYCQREFKRKHHLTDHVKLVHEGCRPHKCDLCERSFGLARTLRIHRMGHTNERPFMCSICEKTFRQKSDLRLHINDHVADSQFRCPICSHCKVSQEELDAHLARHNNKDGYQCSTCGRKFKKLSHLKDHINAVHLKLRPFKCTIEGCGKAFGARRTLQLHMQAHTGISPYSCEICDKRYSSKANVLRHSQTHNDTIVESQDVN